jgi:cysteine desulfurase / selenocysteine lyase
MTAVAHQPAARPVATFDPLRVRADFPILATRTHGKPLVYLDNGATTQKPRQVIDAISRYYESQNANIHRGVYHLSQVATELYESARKKIAAFINAPDERQVLFTRGTTEAINLVAACWGRTFLRPGDEVIVSAMEHHSNIVPWQIACEATGARLRVIPMNDAGELLLDEYGRMLSDGRTKLVSVVHVSNSLGTINDVRRIAEMAHDARALVMVDGAQWVAHHPTDVQDLGADFYAFSGHKLFGPTGIGVLYGRRELLERMPPYQGGGDMIESVTFERTTYAPLPNKFEAGTPDIAGAIGLGAAIDYVRSIGFDAFEPYEAGLLAYATERLLTVPGLRIVGTARHKGGVLSFVLENPPVAALDIGMKLDLDGVAVRTGHHCCQPVMDRFCIPATTRASLAFYNTRADIDALVAGLQKIVAEAKESNRSAAAAASPKSAADSPNGDGNGKSAGTAAEVVYPKAAAASPAEAAEDLAESFEMLEERDEKNQYVLDLGQRLPHTFDLLKTVTTRVPGCMSEVYVVGRRAPGSSDTLEFVADANADIVRGLIAILQRLYSGQRAADVLAFDVEGFFRRIGLDQFITSQRRNGLAGMVQRIRGMAEQIQK